MNWPNALDALIDYGEDDQKEKKSSLIRSVPHYGPFGPMAEYITPDGEKFWVDGEYLKECQDKKTIVRIPVEVIRKNAEIQKKLDFGQRQINKQYQQEQSKLILPDTYADAIKV
jgi:hypothetical protein